MLFLLEIGLGISYCSFVLKYVVNISEEDGCGLGCVVLHC
jgi:hypothetical protein